MQEVINCYFMKMQIVLPINNLMHIRAWASA